MLYKGIPATLIKEGNMYHYCPIEEGTVSDVKNSIVWVIRVWDAERYGSYGSNIGVEYISTRTNRKVKDTWAVNSDYYNKGWTLRSLV